MRRVSAQHGNAGGPDCREYAHADVEHTYTCTAERTSLNICRTLWKLGYKNLCQPTKTLLFRPLHSSGGNWVRLNDVE